MMEYCKNCPVPNQAVNGEKVCDYYGVLNCWLDWCQDKGLTKIPNGTTRFDIADNIYAIMKPYLK